MKILSLPSAKRKKYIISNTEYKYWWNWSTDSSHTAGHKNTQRINVGGQEFTPTLTSRQTLLDFVGQGWLSYIVFPIAPTSSDVQEIWATINGKEYYFRHCQDENGDLNKEYQGSVRCMGISFNGINPGKNGRILVFPIMSSAIVGDAIEITSGLKVEYATTTVQTSETGLFANGKNLHVVYNTDKFISDSYPTQPCYLADL